MSQSDRPSRGAQILIVEDDDGTADAVQAGLIEAGYGVRRVASADDALVTLEQPHVDLVLMSLMLPDTDGLILCSTLTTRYAIPVIVLSARGGEVDRALARESGAIDLLTTPVDVDALLARVHTAVQAFHFVSAQSRRSAR